MTASEAILRIHVSADLHDSAGETKVVLTAPLERPELPRSASYSRQCTPQQRQAVGLELSPPCSA